MEPGRFQTSDVFAETEAARLIADDVIVEKAISDASMLAVAPSIPPIQIPPPPLLPQDEDAYFHPGGEIRSIATPSEEIRVTEKKLRAKARRSWVFTMVVAIALPVVLVAIIVAIGRTTTLGESPTIQAAARAARAPRVAADSRTALASPVGLRASLKPAKPAVRPAAAASRPAFGRRSSR